MYVLFISSVSYCAFAGSQIKNILTYLLTYLRLLLVMYLLIHTILTYLLAYLLTYPFNFLLTYLLINNYLLITNSSFCVLMVTFS